MPDYAVTWDIEISASGPREAARKALRIQRNPASMATCFTVVNTKGNVLQLDLLEENELHVSELVAAVGDMMDRFEVLLYCRDEDDKPNQDCYRRVQRALKKITGGD